MAAVAPSWKGRGPGSYCIGLTNLARPEALAAGCESRALPDVCRGGPNRLVVQPQAKLNGTRLVALSANGTKGRCTVEAVWIAEVGAVEDIPELSFETKIQSFL